MTETETKDMLELIHKLSERIKALETEMEAMRKNRLHERHKGSLSGTSYSDW